MIDRALPDRRTFLRGSAGLAGAVAVGTAAGPGGTASGSAPFEFDFAQAVTAGWSDPLRSLLQVPDWTPPTGDAEGRPVDTSRVLSSVVVDWPAGYGDLSVGLNPSTSVWQGSIYGLPVQRVAPGAPTESFLEVNPWAGNQVRSVDLPVPVAGSRWIEGNPNVGGAFDRHWLGVCPETGEAWEAIGVNIHARTCLASGRWAQDRWSDGGPVCAGGVVMSRVLLDRDDRPHRLGLALNDYAGHDGSRTWAFPRVGDVVRLSVEAGARLSAQDGLSNRRWAFIRSAVQYGFVIYDRTGLPDPSVSVGWVAGAQWDGHSLGELDIKVRDLELVTAST